MAYVDDRAVRVYGVDPSRDHFDSYVQLDEARAHLADSDA
jgi:hypothetical protein